MKMEFKSTGGWVDVYMHKLPALNIVILGWYLMGFNFVLPASGQIVINELYYAPPDKTTHTEFVELFNAGTQSIDLSGWSIAGGITYVFPPTPALAPGAFCVVAQDASALATHFGVSALGPFQGSLNNEGDTIRLFNNSGDLVDEVKYGTGFPWPCAASGDGCSLELNNPHSDNSLGCNWRSSGWSDVESRPEDGYPEVVDRGAAPTPGAPNTVYTAVPPPQIIGVTHTPDWPAATNAVTISAQVADPRGIAAVWLQYQIVTPGDYITANEPLPFANLIFFPERPNPWNPRFGAATNWNVVPMVDDGSRGDAQSGDGLFTAVIPPLPNRTLLRYRIFAESLGTPRLQTIAPLSDDPSLNFAYFVYDGIPAYRPAYSTVQPEGLGFEYSAEVMNSLPAYFLLTPKEDMDVCSGWSSFQWIASDRDASRSKFNWEGAFVYEGTVYDHIRYRLRKDNDRYNGGYGGKRNMRFRFHRGHYFAAKDDNGNLYPEKWQSLDTGNMQSNFRDNNFGLVETINSRLWNLLNVPAPLIHTFQFRVVSGPEEAPAGPEGQFNGDFWGMYLAIEDYDSRFLKNHGLPDGNLYKLKFDVFDGNLLKRCQGLLSVTNDEDFQNIFHNTTPEQTDEWLRAHVNYDLTYRYHAVCEAVRHYDFAPLPAFLKNRAWFFDPTVNQPLGQLWTLPWDFDVSWGPCYGVDGGIDYPLNAILSGAGKPAFKLEYRNALREFRDLVWNEETVTNLIDALAARVAVFSQADRDRWKDATNGFDTGPISDKVTDMKNFAFYGWNGATGPAVEAGGRAASIDALASAEGEDGLIPATPTITSTSTNLGQIGQLFFAVSEFADPQGSDTFGALEWRLAEITDPAAPAYQASAPRFFEWNAGWSNGPSPTFVSAIAIPASAVQTGHAYRVRARMRDNTGRWSHWSAPIQFIAQKSVQFTQLQADLRITEIMFHPSGGDAYEYLQLANIGTNTLSLADLSFASGITFAFTNSTYKKLTAGQCIVLARDKASFLARYPNSANAFAGQYDGQLSNSGETLRLVSASMGDILTAVYRDDWYPETDGGGYSLILRSPQKEADAQSQKSWRPSLIPYGAPGTSEETQDRDADTMPDYWELANGLNPSNAADALIDLDGDGESSAREFFAGTNPNLAGDAFRLAIKIDGVNVVISFTAKAANPIYCPNMTRYYTIERRDPNMRWMAIDSSIVATNQTVTVTDPLSSTVNYFPVYRAKTWLQ